MRAVCAFLIFTTCLLGAQASDIVGAWRGKMYKNTVFQFRKDGTYVGTSKETFGNGQPKVDVRAEGTWRKSGNHIYVKVTRRTSGNIPAANKAKFDKQNKHILGKEVKMPIKWISKDEWQPTDVGVGTFVRVKP